MPDTLNPQRMLLAKLRGNDFTHAGDQQAIDLVLCDINNLLMSHPDLQILDVGCGLGGTASQFQKQGLGHVSGIDIDNAAIQHAKIHYPAVNFFTGDVMDVADIFKPHQFDLIYMFNVFYAFQHQQASLFSLAKVAKPGAIIAIFDYVHLDTTQPFALQDLAEKSMHPIVEEKLYEWLANAGWELVKESDLSQQYINWYQELIIKLNNNRIDLIREFTQSIFDKVYFAFTHLLEQLNKKILGGVVVYARLHASVNVHVYGI